VKLTLSPKRLARLLARELESTGYRATDTVAEAPRLPWDRPRLFTDLDLGGQDLQPYLAIRCALDESGLVDAYERFIAGFLFKRALHKFHPDIWLKESTGIPYLDARMLFPRPGFNQERRDYHLNLVQFAALVAYNHDTHIEHGPATFVVALPGSALQFGVRDGRLVSNLERERRKIPVRGLEVPGGRLVDFSRVAYGDVASRKGSVVYDTLRAWVTERAGALGSRAAGLLFALSIMRWRMPYHVPLVLRLAGATASSAEALHDACRQARDWRYFDEPYRQMKELFVPAFLEWTDFGELFGGPPRRGTTPVSKELGQKWDSAIESLDPGQQGDELEEETAIAA